MAKKVIVSDAGNAPAREGIALIDENLLKSKVYTIRGVKVMLDADLAEIYGYETKAFNRQVKNNIKRFPDLFRFQLTDEECAILRCKNCTSSWGGQRYNPYAFTEQGIYMLMTVLKGDLAIQQSVALIRLFKSMKDYIVAENQQLLGCVNCAQIATLTAQNAKEIAEIRSDVVYDLKPADNKFHDRYIVLDFGTKTEKMFHCGASSKDAGGKITTIMQIEDVDVYRGVIEELLSRTYL